MCETRANRTVIYFYIINNNYYDNDHRVMPMKVDGFSRAYVYRYSYYNTDRKD